MPKPEDRKLTPRENYLRVLTGQMPEWVPIYKAYAEGVPENDPLPIAKVFPEILDDPHYKGGGTDCWGVEWVGNPETGWTLMPDTSKFILDDIENWHDVVKAPDISDVDWESMCRKTIEDHWPYDRDQTAMAIYLCTGIFQEMMGILGFTEGLVAMIEEPEESAELCMYMTDFYLDVAKHCMPYIKPDVLIFADDTASAKAPFISEDLYRQILLPCYKKLDEELGIPVQYHCCGLSQNLVSIAKEEIPLIGGWEQAQVMNDLDGFKERWGRDFAIVGGYDAATQELLDPDCPDEAIVESVHRTVDRLAPDGGYIFIGEFFGSVGDESIAHKNAVVMQAARDYCNVFYD